MFAALAVLTAVAFLLFTFAMPFCRESWTRKCLLALADATVHATPHVSIYRQSEGERCQLVWARVWGATTAAAFAILSLSHGRVFFDHPLSIATTGLYALLAVAVSSLIIVTAHSYASFVPRTRGFAALRECGLQGLWLVNSKKQPIGLKRYFASSIGQTSGVGIVDVTGHTLLGKGSGPGGSLLYEAIAGATNVPVSVLLLNPQTKAVDPERRKLTVIQEVHADMQISEAMYQRRVRATLDAITDLNEQRPPEGRIEVRLYNEKPWISAILFDQAVLVSPWDPLERELMYTLFEASTRHTAPSFFEVYRRQFVRMWAGAQPAELNLDTFLRDGSRAVRKQAMALNRTTRATT